MKKLNVLLAICFLLWLGTVITGCLVLKTDVKFGIENGSPVIGFEIGIDRSGSVVYDSTSD